MSPIVLRSAATPGQVIFSGDAERAIYLDLFRHYSELHGLTLLGYCLMSNHVHLVVVPQAAEALAETLKHTHGRYASCWNAGNSSSGQVWQGRFYSCPLEETHLWRARNPSETWGTLCERTHVVARRVVGPRTWHPCRGTRVG